MGLQEHSLILPGSERVLKKVDNSSGYLTASGSQPKWLVEHFVFYRSLSLIAAPIFLLLGTAWKLNQ
jgi:hypothetical protein